MNPKELDVVQWYMERERERLMREPPPPQRPPEQPTLHWTELTPLPPGDRMATEWNYYLKHVGRLLAEGHEGRWVLIHGEAIIGIWDTQQEADQVRAQRFLQQDVLIQQVLSREPILRSLIFLRPWLS